MGMKGKAYKRPDVDVLAALLFKHHGVVATCFNAFNATLKPAERIAYVTFRRIIQDPVVLKLYSDMRAEATNAGLSFIQERCLTAAQIIDSIAMEGESDIVRLSAAKSIIEFARHAQMDELMRKLDRLEDAFVAAHGPLIADDEEKK